MHSLLWRLVSPRSDEGLYSVALFRILRKWFRVIMVDEYRTSKICNKCRGELNSYRKRDGKQSYSRLCCTKCAGRSSKNRSKQFVDRDFNAALNIMEVGISPVRPLCFTRRKREREKEKKET